MIINSEDLNQCRICGKQITIAIRKNTRICSGNCEKIWWERLDKK